MDISTNFGWPISTKIFKIRFSERNEETKKKGKRLPEMEQNQYNPIQQPIYNPEPPKNQHEKKQTQLYHIKKEGIKYIYFTTKRTSKRTRR